MGGGEKKKANNFENSLKKLNLSRLWLNTSENDSGYNDLPGHRVQQHTGHV